MKYLYIICFTSIASYCSIAADFEFPQKSQIYYSEDRRFDASGLKLDISKMLRGGIGYGANATLLLASGMRAIGSNQQVHNAPFCIHRRNSFDFKDDYKLWSDAVNDLKPASNIAEFQRDIRLLNLPLDIDGHASLATIEFKEDFIEEIIFFDSMTNEDVYYDERYNEELVKAIMKFIPNNNTSSPSYRVVHALYQGGEGSNGCGYYTLFTAMLLKQNPDLITHHPYLLYDVNHDHLIRASVALISFMHEDIWKSKSYRFDDTKAKTKVHNMLEISELDIAKTIWPRWYKIIGNENDMELWIKYNDLTRIKWSELIASSIWYQAALELPACYYKTRTEISNMVMDLALVIVGQEILAKFSLKHLNSWRKWLDKQGYEYAPKFHLFGKEEILKKELGIF
jgi:hypothetical protein